MPLSVFDWPPNQKIAGRSKRFRNLHDDIVNEWRKNKIQRGLSNENAIQSGRTYQARLSPFEEKIPQQHLLGGGRRLTHPDPEIDLKISILEAFWYPHTPPAWFAAKVNHPESAIQLTAAKFVLLIERVTFINKHYSSTKESLTDAIRWHFDTCPLR